MSGLDRMEILRRDCPDCGGKGYIGVAPLENACGECGGSGMLEKEIPFKFEGPRTKEEIAEIWGVTVDELPSIDKGHDAPSMGQQGGAGDDI